MLGANVKIECFDVKGKLIKVIEGSNAVTRAGKEWAAKRLFGTTVANQYLGRTTSNPTKLQVNVNGQWRDSTITSSRSGAVVTMVGSYTYIGNNSRTTTARIFLPGKSAPNPEADAVYAFFTLPSVFVGAAGGSIRITWTLRVSYSGVNSYDQTEVSVVRETPGGQATRQLWIPTTDEPIVATNIMKILYEDNSTGVNRFTHGQVRMFKFDTTGLSSDDIDEIGDAGPFPIVQEDPLINGTFAVNTVVPGGDFTFAWSGVGSDTGVMRKRWFFMTLGPSARTANSSRWMAGAILESDDTPTTSTTYVTGIKFQL